MSASAILSAAESAATSVVASASSAITAASSSATAASAALNASKSAVAAAAAASPSFVGGVIASAAADSKEIGWVEVLLRVVGLLYGIVMTVLSTLAGAAVKTLKLEVPTAVKVIFWILCLINIKNVPLTWHFRFYRSLITHMWIRRRSYPKPSHLFTPIVTASRSPLYECDLNGHKSNSTYFADLDIARTHLVAHLTKRSFQVRKKRGDPLMYVALAGVTCLFRREIKPFARYEIHSRVLGWDGKWVFVVSHFVTPGWKPDDKRHKIFASSLSKYVFKSGRITVPPEVVFQESGLMPQRPQGSVATPRSVSPANGGEDEGLVEGATAESQIERLVPDMKQTKGAEETFWTWERIEQERKRGLEVARGILELDGLDAEVRTGKEQGLEKVPGWFMGF